ncbi:MAG TPA: DoxX family membrane protein [Candidatus Nanoarchaeia archaeon]|nr:DoxX family membrane protein [Candidatus Nanoarchaeia archaeon]
MHNLEKYAPPLLRITLSLVFLYFGYQQITAPAEWAGFVPNAALLFGTSATTIVIGNALLELSLGTLLLLGLYTRFSSLILSLHLFGIAFSLGFNDLGVRDFGLAVATLVIFLNGADFLTLDKKFAKNPKHTPTPY